MRVDTTAWKKRVPQLPVTDGHKDCRVGEELFLSHAEIASSIVVISTAVFVMLRERNCTGTVADCLPILDMIDGERHTVMNTAGSAFGRSMLVRMTASSRGDRCSSIHVRVILGPEWSIIFETLLLFGLPRFTLTSGKKTV